MSVLARLRPSRSTTFNAEFAELAENLSFCGFCGFCVDRRHPSGAGFRVVIAIGRHTSRLIIAL
jgi:hypothetical protein